MINNDKFGVFIVPTGIGASIGGFAGDASKWARKLATKCKLMVNPNVVNAACFSGITDNMLYTEGFIIDEFFRKKCSLKPATNNKIGVIFDKAIKDDVFNVHINTINAVKTVYDIDIIGYETTKENVGVEFFIDNNNFSTGNIKNIDTIKKSAEKLIQRGANAIAIVCRFPDDDNNQYEQGIGADPVGGVEAIISHYISKEFKIPCAHAPAFDNYNIDSNIVDPRCSAEYITPTFLPCILIGLNNAPLICDYSSNNLSVDDVDFIVIPANSLGGIPVLEAAKLNIPIYAVQENKTLLNVTNKHFGIKCDIINTYSDLLELI